MTRVLGVAALAAVAFGIASGCEEKRNYPAGFEAAAAQGRPTERPTVKKPGASLGGSGGSGDAASAASSTSFAAARAPEAPSDVVESGEAGSGDDRVEEAPGSSAVTSEQVARELNLPPAPPVVVADGEEPQHKQARDPRFEEFRRMSGRFIQLRRELLPYGQKLADGTATPEDRRIHDRLQDASDQEFKRLNAYMWRDRWSEEDRAAMGWILFGGLQPGAPR